mgnify:FL=1
MDNTLRYNISGDCFMYRRIRDLREDSDMTQTQLAEILHCSQRVYSDYERGKLDIPTEILIKLADFHEVSVDYILERTDNKRLYK